MPHIISRTIEPLGEPFDAGASFPVSLGPVRDSPLNIDDRVPLFPRYDVPEMNQLFVCYQGADKLTLAFGYLDVGHDIFKSYFPMTESDEEFKLRNRLGTGLSSDAEQIALDLRYLARTENREHIVAGYSHVYDVNYYREMAIYVASKIAKWVGNPVHFDPNGSGKMQFDAILKRVRVVPIYRRMIQRQARGIIPDIDNSPGALDRDFLIPTEAGAYYWNIGKRDREYSFAVVMSFISDTGYPMTYENIINNSYNTGFNPVGALSDFSLSVGKDAGDEFPHTIQDPPLYTSHAENETSYFSGIEYPTLHLERLNDSYGDVPDRDPVSTLRPWAVTSDKPVEEHPMLYVVTSPGRLDSDQITQTSRIIHQYRNLSLEGTFTVTDKVITFSSDKVPSIKIDINQSVEANQTLRFTGDGNEVTQEIDQSGIEQTATVFENLIGDASGGSILPRAFKETLRGTVAGLTFSGFLPDEILTINNTEFRIKQAFQDKANKWDVIVERLVTSERVDASLYRPVRYEDFYPTTTTYQAYRRSVANRYGITYGDQ